MPLAILLLLGAACEAPREAPAPRRPEVVLARVQMRSFRGERLVAVGWAESLTYARASSDVEAEQASLRMPRRFGPGPRAPGDVGGVEIRAPVVDGNLATQQLEGRGGVHARTASGVTGFTERARFDGPTMVASGADPVMVRGPQYVLDAHGFTFRTVEDDFEFGGPVHSGVGGKLR